MIRHFQYDGQVIGHYPLRKGNECQLNMLATTLVAIRLMD